MDHTSYALRNIYKGKSLLNGCAKMPNSLKEVETTIPEIPAVIKVPVTDEVGNTVGAITPVERGNIDAIRAQLEYVVTIEHPALRTKSWTGKEEHGASIQ